MTKIGQNVSCNDKLRQAKQFFFAVIGSSLVPEYLVTFPAFHVNAMGSIQHYRFRPDSPILTKIGQKVSCNDLVQQAKQVFFAVIGSSLVPEYLVTFPVLHVNAMGSISHDRFQPDSPILTKIGQNVSSND